MKALQWDAELGKVSLLDLDKPSIKSPNEVLIKVAYSGVCGTDLHVILKEFPAAPKLIMGHEFTGIIEAVGSGVSGLKVGAKVAVDPEGNCKECRFCTEGHPNYCNEGGLRSTIGLFRNGGWAEFCVVPAPQVYGLPDDADLAISALTEPYSCVERGWENLGNILANADILITGAGIIGLLWACLLHHRGYRKISISELTQERRQIAQDLGLDLTVIQPSDLASKFKGVDPAVDGLDLVIDCTGSPRSIESVFPFLRRGATLCIFGCCPQKSKISIDPHEIFARELKIVGVLINPFTFPRSVTTVYNMANKYLQLSKLGIKIYSLEESCQAFEDLKRCRISKAMFKI